MSRPITPGTTLENLKQGSQALVQGHSCRRRGGAREASTQAYPQAPGAPTLRDVQHALALRVRLPGLDRAQDAARRGRADSPVRTRRRGAGDRVPHARRRARCASSGNTSATCARGTAMRRYIRLDLGQARSSRRRPEEDVITIAEARYLVARAQGFESWEALECVRRPRLPASTIARRESGGGVLAAMSRGRNAMMPRAPATGTRSSRLMRERQLTGAARGRADDRCAARARSRGSITSPRSTSGSKRAHRRRAAPPRAAAAAAAAESGGVQRRSPIAGSRCCGDCPQLESIDLAWTPDHRCRRGAPRGLPRTSSGRSRRHADRRRRDSRARGQSASCAISDPATA